MILKPTCAVCKKPVDLFWSIRNPGCDDLVYIAKCHGQAEQVTITYVDQVTMADKTITLTEAFASKKLPA